MAEPFIGQIELFPYTFAPYGWLICNGQLLPVQQFAALFSLLGTQYGGNGTTNFGLPNLQGCVPVGQGTSTGGTVYDMGETGGAPSVTLTTSTIPPHNHSLNTNTSIGVNNIAQNQVPAQSEIPGETARDPAVKINMYLQAVPNVSLNQSSIVPATGGGIPHVNMQPFLALGYYIATSGVFPARP